MIVCPNCDHHNPEGATQCEACYTPLPEMMPCPNCGAQVQVDANFCGQCGFNIQPPGEALPTAMEASAAPSGAVSPSMASEEIGAASFSGEERASSDLDASLEEGFSQGLNFEADLEAALDASAEQSAAVVLTEEALTPPSISQTQLQRPLAKMLHIRSNVTVALPESLSVVHIGKANDRIPPDIDVSGFPDSEVVSRVHADIRIEGDAYYIEDLGSSNGTYVNNLPLVPGNRHRLRVGDRISLGKGDLVTFLFQVA